MVTAVVTVFGLNELPRLFGGDSGDVVEVVATTTTNSTMQSTVSVATSTSEQNTATTVTSVPPSSSPVRVTTTAPVLVAATFTSLDTEQLPEVGQTIVLADRYSTNHDGKPSYSVRDASVCQVANGQATLTAAGECVVAVKFPKTKKFKAISQSLSLRVQDRGLTPAELDVLGPVCCNDSSDQSASRTYYVTYGRALDTLQRPSGDFKKKWKMTLSVGMPSFLPQGANCLNIYVNYRFRGTGTVPVFGNTDHSKTTISCSSEARVFTRCVEFLPSIGSAGYPQFPEDNNEMVTLDLLYWAIKWSSSPVDHPRSAKERPEVTVTDTRPGSCS